MKTINIIALVLVSVSGISAVGGWIYGKNQNDVNWQELSERNKKELSSSMHLDYQLSDLITTKISDLKLYGPKKAGGPKMLYIYDEDYSVTLSDSYVVVRFSDGDAISVSDIDGDGYFEQIVNVVENEQGDVLEMLDRNRDGSTDILFKNGEKVSLTE